MDGVMVHTYGEGRKELKGVVERRKQRGINPKREMICGVKGVYNRCSCV